MIRPGGDSTIERDPRRLRIGAVGCGRVFERYHLPSLRDSRDFELVAVCDVRADRLAQTRRVMPGAACYETTETMLAETPLDAVLVTTPTVTHFDVASRALQAGHPVLVEKPMATSVEHAGKMAADAGTRGVHLGVGFNRRFRRTFSDLERRLNRHGRERVRAIGYEFIANQKQWSSVTTLPVSDDPVVEVLHDVGSHQVDLIPWLTGRSIHRVRWLEDTAGDETIVDFEVVLDGGLVAGCRAGHAARYHERLDVTGDDRRWLVLPGGLFERRRLPEGLARLAGRVRNTGDLAMNRVLRRPGLTARSFRQEQAWFAAAVRGSDLDGGADARAGLRAACAIEAIERSRACDGAWQDLQEPS